MIPIPDHEYTVVEFWYTSTPLWDEVLEWLTENVGMPGPATWFCIRSKLYFYNAKHHLAFVIKYS